MILSKQSGWLNPREKGLIKTLCEKEKKAGNQQFLLFLLRFLPF